MPAYPAPRPVHLPKAEAQRLAIGLLLLRQGWTSDQMSTLLEQVGQLQRARLLRSGAVETQEIATHA